MIQLAGTILEIKLEILGGRYHSQTTHRGRRWKVGGYTIYRLNDGPAPAGLSNLVAAIIWGLRRNKVSYIHLEIMVGLLTLSNSTSMAGLRTRANALLQHSLISHAKTTIFYYVLLFQYLRFYRHLRARGIRTSISEFYTWISKVRSF